MCVANSIQMPRKQYLRLKEILKELTRLEYERLQIPFQSGFDYREWPVLKPSPDGMDVNLSFMEWGIIPSFIHTRADAEKFRKGYKDERGYHPPRLTLNAIGEEMFDKTSFKDAARNRRCLVLSSGFFEWRHMPKTGKSGKVLKQTDTYPYCVFMPGHNYFYMAGIYQPFTDTETGELIDTFAIVTKKAIGIMEQVHNIKKRMPVIFTEEDARRWILPNLTDEEILELVNKDLHKAYLDAHPVAKDFRTSPHPSAEVMYTELPALVK